MKAIQELNFGYSDAENYKRRENKELFNDIFLRTPSLDTLCEQSCYFLIGEKGTGKTAYAVYLSNNSYKNHSAELRYIRETEYQKFLSLKKEKHLVLTDYTNIWKVIICLLLAEQIRRREGKRGLLSGFSKFRNLERAVDEYYANAFSPEIIYAIQFVEEAKLTAKLLAKYAQVGGDQKEAITLTESRFQTHLMFIQQKFEESLASLKLDHNYLLFIDGIDIRPSSVPYADYLDCIKGLANAVWSINNDFFAGIRDSRGRMRVVLLLRPDIFDTLGLQNQNAKIRDNAVMLDWRTTYPEHRNSAIFQIADKLLNAQQSEVLRPGDAWDYYFPYEVRDARTGKRSDSPFVMFLRFAYYRPRDIVTMLGILQENFIEQNRRSDDQFRAKDFNHPSFRRKLAEYLLGEVKDHLSFYYSAEDYEIFLKFFEYLKGVPRFTYEEYLQAFTSFEVFLRSNNIWVWLLSVGNLCSLPLEMKSPELLPVSIQEDSPELQESFCSFFLPAHSRLLHPILDQSLHRRLHHATSDRIPLPSRAGIVHGSSVLLKIADDLAHLLATLRALEPFGFGDPLLQSSNEIAYSARLQLGFLLRHPSLRF